jgi:DNA polymerase-3 subunit delta'
MINTLPFWLQPVYDRFASKQRQRGHAFLFLGAEGLGQETLIDRIALHWLGGDSLQDHPDMMRVARIEGKRDITVDQIREVTQWSQQTAHGHIGRVVIIEQAEYLNTAAANSLLKTLEEPPEGVRFLITASRAGKLLPTILSRCQRVALPVPEVTAAQQWLQTQVKGASTAEIVLALRLHSDAPLAAQAWLTGVGLSEWRDWQQHWQQSQQAQAVVTGLSDWARKDMERFCRHLSAQSYVDGQQTQAASSWQLLRLTWQVQRALRQNMSKDLLLDNLLIAIGQHLVGAFPQLTLSARRGALA